MSVCINLFFVNVTGTFQAILASDGTNTFAVFLYDRIDGINDASVSKFYRMHIK